ncbi:MAG: hypothetical protein J6112_06360, partial [Clostridia bacterium]|nr:hypothetical protein [Clostridia bacterium]
MKDKTGKKRNSVKTKSSFSFVKMLPFAVVVAIVLAGLVTGLLKSTLTGHAEEEPAATYIITSFQEFEEYSKAYASGSRNPKDVLRIQSLIADEYANGDGFVSLGTSDRPFAGTIITPALSEDTFRLYDCPLFDYVSTDLQFKDFNNNANVVKIVRLKLPDVPKEGTLTHGSLFANHVVAGTNDADWSIVLEQATGDDISSQSFESLIGDIAANASVTVAFENNTSLNVSGQANTGYLCGTLNSGAELTATVTGSVSGRSVTTTSGNAGGMVGEMAEGSTLNLTTTKNPVTSVTTSGGYAGGLVGKATKATVDPTQYTGDYTVSGTVTGTTGAGGVFGYYENDADNATFSLQNSFNVSSGTQITSSDYSGGVFGVLKNTGSLFTFDGNKTGSETVSTVLSGKNSGGVAGGYKTDDLANTLAITNTATSISASGYEASGGILGKLMDDSGAEAAYVSISEVSANANALGGLVGTAGSKGSFIDVSGNIAVSGTCDAGLVGKLPEGVLRIKGVTDLSAFDVRTLGTRMENCGILVRDRDRALVYSIGSGSDANWQLKRKLANGTDDIKSWGQVVRTNTSDFKESDLFTVNTTAHTVTVKSAVTEMGTKVDFAKTALNIQLNTAAAKGALKFADTTPNSSTLLSGTLSLSSDISLTGTGILGLTRDNGANDPFSGTFNGNNHTLTLATGEPYGLQGTGAALASDSKQGNIFNHSHSGLFAKTSGATINNLTINGKTFIYQKADGMSSGTVTGEATNALTLSNVTVDTDYHLDFRTAGDYSGYLGGAVGLASGTGVSVSVSGGNYKPTITDKSSTEASGNTKYSNIGGVIGYLSGYKDSSNTVEFNGTNIGLVYTKTGNNTTRTSVFGSAIGSTSGTSYTKNRRRIDFTNVNVDITASGTAAGDRFGGILGMSWLATNVYVNGLTVDNASITSTSGNANYGGLFHTLTGYAEINQLDLTSANFNLSGVSSSTFGFIANKTYNTANGGSALYLELDNTDSHYNIGALTFSSGGTFRAFDEVVADSRYNGTGIETNGQSIISIKTTGNVIDTTGCNTYLNKTAYGQTSSGEVNPYTRYYYNIAYARENTSTPKYNFLVWSVNTYAHSSLSSWFSSSSTFTGDLDMRGLSYYPVDLKEDVTFNNATLTLDNVLMEDHVQYSYGTTTGRTTRANTNQHYLMHTAAFRNDSASKITISGNNGLTIRGNVPKISDSFCGFLVAGAMGTSDTARAELTASKILLDGARIITNSGTDITSSSTYAPVLINKIQKNTTLEISSAGQSNYGTLVSGGKYAGSSLIGNVGSETARGINLTFSGLQFDARGSASSIGNMDTVYGTTRSIFGRATILNRFQYAGECRGSYNYEIDEDWPSGTAAHAVTYGKEITTSVEYANKEKKYYGSEYYTHPTVYQSGSEYDFSTGFKPYVYEAYDLANKKHELKVNVSEKTNIEGCGKYDDPFIIDDSEKLPIISAIISGDTGVDPNTTIYLPSDLLNFNHTQTTYTKNLYNFGASNFTSSNGGTARSNANVRRYLAGAYYVITTDITLPNDYVPLGQTDSNSNTQYAFRGVLIGRAVTITNKSDKPLIHTSLGSVVQNIDIVVDVELTGNTHVISLAAPLAAPDTSDEFKYYGSEYYTHPTVYQSGSEYDFSTGFKPYVYEA